MMNQLYLEGCIDWLFSNINTNINSYTQSQSHLYVEQSVRYPGSTIDWNGLGNIEYNDSSISLRFSNHDGSGSEVISGHLLSVYDVKSLPSSW